jgi:hypothetical protein
MTNYHIDLKGYFHVYEHVAWESVQPRALGGDLRITCLISLGGPDSPAAGSSHHECSLDSGIID